jgi:hypothetical protein
MAVRRERAIFFLIVVLHANDGIFVVSYQQAITSGCLLFGQWDVGSTEDGAVLPALIHGDELAALVEEIGGVRLLFHTSLLLVGFCNRMLLWREATGYW